MKQLYSFFRKKAEAQIKIWLTTFRKKVEGKATFFTLFKKKQRAGLEPAKNRAATDCSNRCATSANASDRIRTCDLLLSSLLQKSMKQEPSLLEGSHSIQAELPRHIKKNQFLYLKVFIFSILLYSVQEISCSNPVSFGFSDNKLLR